MKAMTAKWDRFGFTGTAAERRAADLFLADLRGNGAIVSDVENDLREQIEALEPPAFSEADEGQRAQHFSQLLTHAAPGADYDLSGPNCILRWANVPPGYAGAVDVVVHFYGFKAHNAMRLQQKADASGLDLDVAGLTTPTLGIVPHGHAFPARRRCSDRSRRSCPHQTWRAKCPDETRPVLCQDGFDFPALESRRQLLDFVQSALAELARERGSNDLSRGRLIVTGHSGGGAHLSKLLQAFRSSDEITAFQFFDATYGGEEPFKLTDGWLVRSLRRDAGALAGISDADWSGYMRRSGGHLRLAFIAGTRTASVAGNVDRFIVERLRELVSNQALRDFLRRYYRAQSTIGLRHDDIPRAIGGRLLLEPGDDIRGVLQDLPAPPARRRPASRKRAPTEQETWDEEDPPELLELLERSGPDEHVEAHESISAGAGQPIEVREADENGAVNSAALAQSDVDKLATMTLGSASDIHAFFGRQGSPHFSAWYNAELAGKGPFVRRGQPIRMPTSTDARHRFDRFWNQIQTGYGRSQITVLDFAAVMCIVLNETGGRFEGFPERCGAGRSDARGPHPGLAYAFDRIIDVKRSYNTGLGNRSAGTLFNDRDFVAAHGNLAGGAQLAGRGDELERVWHGELFPQQAFGTDENPATSGFIMQADFYKFRGRGVIQTTGRSSYLKLIRFIQRYQGTSALIGQYRDRWRGLTEDAAATVSTTEDWDRLFDDAEILATGPALHGRQGNRDYRIMDLRAEVLNHVPASSGDTRGAPGTIYALGRRVSGRYRYGAGIYRDRVLGLLNAALTLV
jgi:hypothetical protein